MSLLDGSDFPVTDFRAGTLRLGDGAIGGKAQGLVFFNDMLEAEYDPAKFPGIEVLVPGFAVITTAVYDEFLANHGLNDLPFDDLEDEAIERAFQRCALPAAALEFLRRLVESIRVPLAVRSSSLLEDAIFHPLAGVYETKMIPNNQPRAEDRLEKIVEAVRFVYASVHFREARRYLGAIGKRLADEKMALVVQEIVGSTRGERFYPHLSGVARSHNFYPGPGASADEGVVNLALGLGKTIVDGGLAWTYSPSRPAAPPPYASVGDLMKHSQLEFWAVNLAAPEDASSVGETQYLVHADLKRAESDGVLPLLASTYRAESDRMVPGVGWDGPRVLTFAPLLEHRERPLNDVIRELLAIGERAAGADVEIEFAVAADPGDDPLRLGFLQVRPMFVSHETVEITDDELARENLLLMSRHVGGNGTIDGVRDIVYVRPDGFDAKHMRRIAAELDGVDGTLRGLGRPYLLIGFGRWGSSDPWLGVPVRWSSIAGAKVIVEASLPGIPLDPSQGSHFFHNVVSNGVTYLAVLDREDRGIDWAWLARQPAERESGLIRHVALDGPLAIKVDGRGSCAAIWSPG